MMTYLNRSQAQKILDSYPSWRNIQEAINLLESGTWSEALVMPEGTKLRCDLSRPSYLKRFYVTGYIPHESDVKQTLSRL